MLCYYKIFSYYDSSNVLATMQCLFEDSLFDFETSSWLLFFEMMVAMLPSNRHLTKDNISDKYENHIQMKESKRLCSSLYTSSNSTGLSMEKPLKYSHAVIL